MKQVAFTTSKGSAYVVSFREAGGIDVVRVSDHPVAGRASNSTSFSESFDAVEFLTAVDGLRVRFRSYRRPSSDYVTSPVVNLRDVAAR